MYLLAMTGFKPQNSGVRSDSSTNCATTTDQLDKLFYFCISDGSNCYNEQVVAVAQNSYF